MVKLDTSYYITQVPTSETNSQYLDSSVSVQNVLPLSQNFWKNPKNNIIVLLSVVFFVELTTWVLMPQFKESVFKQYQNFFHYAKNFIFGFAAPELCTLLILSLLINRFHRIFRFNQLEMTARSIIKYELSFLPLFLVSFFVFFPVTLHVRFLLRKFPAITMSSYSSYVTDALTWDTYFLYLPFVIVLGYVMVNVSLIKDFIEVRQIAPMPNHTILQAAPEVLSQHLSTTELANQSVTPIANNYLQTVVAKDAMGDVVLDVKDCYYFETDGKYVYAAHPNGTYRLIKTLSNLFEELDPQVFFKGSRNYLLNLGFVKSFTYWEKGKYIIYLNVPDAKDLVMPRAQLQNFKESLQKYVLKSN